MIQRNQQRNQILFLLSLPILRWERLGQIWEFTRMSEYVLTHTMNPMDYLCIHSLFFSLKTHKILFHIKEQSTWFMVQLVAHWNYSSDWSLQQYYNRLLKKWNTSSHIFHLIDSYLSTKPGALLISWLQTQILAISI